MEAVENHQQKFDPKARGGLAQKTDCRPMPSFKIATPKMKQKLNIRTVSHIVALVFCVVLPIQAGDGPKTRPSKKPSKNATSPTRAIPLDDFGNPAALLGNSWITESPRIRSGLDYGIFPDSFVVKPLCKENPEIHPEFSVGIKQDSSLLLHWEKTANCCQKFLAEFDFINDSTINFITNSYGTYCACDCVSELSLKVRYEPLRDDYEKKFSDIKYYALNGVGSNKFTLSPKEFIGRIRLLQAVP